MPDQQAHKVRKSKRTDTSTVLKRLLCSIIPSLVRFRQKQSSISATNIQGSFITDALRNKYDSVLNRVATAGFIEIKEDTKALDISILPARATNPEIQHISRRSSRKRVTSSSSSSPNLETDMHIHQTIFQSSGSLSSDISLDEELEVRTAEFQRMNIQDNFIKSLVSRLTKERREEKMILRDSRRYRCLATVKRVMDSGLVIPSQVLEKFKQERKRKFDEQST